VNGCHETFKNAKFFMNNLHIMVDEHHEYGRID
jgi:hypothetical protein